MIKELFTTILLICSALFCIWLLWWTLSTLQAYSNLSHEQNIKELELEKEIALIKTNNVSKIYGDVNSYGSCVVFEEDSSGYKHTQYFEYCYMIR